ncbi:hypothetical protein RAA17_16475 [Komagataeibacter rhaeticus]|nr:hypothetical protein [Komagataeibacter rhaeticus]
MENAGLRHFDLTGWYSPQFYRPLRIQAGMYNIFNKTYYNAASLPYGQSSSSLSERYLHAARPLVQGNGKDRILMVDKPAHHGRMEMGRRLFACLLAGGMLATPRTGWGAEEDTVTDCRGGT